MTFSIDNPRGLQQPPFGKHVWEKPSGEQGLMALTCSSNSKYLTCLGMFVFHIMRKKGSGLT